MLLLSIYVLYYNVKYIYLVKIDLLNLLNLLNLLLVQYASTYNLINKKTLHLQLGINDVYTILYSFHVELFGTDAHDIGSQPHAQWWFAVIS